MKLTCGSYTVEVTVTQDSKEPDLSLKVGQSVDDGIGMIFWVDPSDKMEMCIRDRDMTFDKDGDLWLTTSFDLIRVNLKAGIAHSYPFSQIAQSTAQHHINHILCDRCV